MNIDESILPSSRRIKFITVSIPCVLAVYVLSIGPMAKLDDLGFLGESANRTVSALYSPLAWFSTVPAAEKLLNWYIFDVWQCDRMGDISH